MDKVLHLIGQRRVWAGILGVVVFILTTLKVNLDLDIPLLTELLTSAGVAAVALVQAILSLWSYLKPKIAEATKKSKKK